MTLLSRIRWGQDVLWVHYMNSLVHQRCLDAILPYFLPRLSQPVELELVPDVFFKQHDRHPHPVG